MFELHPTDNKLSINDIYPYGRFLKVLRKYVNNSKQSLTRYVFKYMRTPLPVRATPYSDIEIRASFIKKRFAVKKQYFEKRETNMCDTSPSQFRAIGSIFILRRFDLLPDIDPYPASSVSSAQQF